MTVKELIYQLSDHCVSCTIGYTCNGESIFEIEKYYEKELKDYLIDPTSNGHLEISLYFNK